MIRITNLNMPLSVTEEELHRAAARRLGIPKTSIRALHIARRRTRRAF